MHLVVGTPCYGGMMCTEYTQSILALKEGLDASGHKLTCIFLGNESLIQRGRNTIAHHFLKTDASHLLFVDADQKFRPADVANMIRADKDIIVGPVPMKGINWERIRMGATLGFKNLSNLSGIFNITPLDGHEMSDPNQPFQIKHGGTGFMLIKREVFDKLKQFTQTYTNGGSSIPPGEAVFDFFQVAVKDKQLLSEDYNFCDNYRSIGGTIWAAPWCELGHFGSYCFSGVYKDSVV